MRTLGSEALTLRTTFAVTASSLYKPTLAEEEMLVQYVLDLGSRGFPPWIYGVEDIANLLLMTCCKKPVGKLWAHRFIRHCPKLKMRFLHAYDF